MCNQPRVVLVLFLVPAGAAEQQDGTAPSKSDQAYFEQHMAAVMAASAAAGGRNVARIVDPKTGVQEAMVAVWGLSVCRPLCLSACFLGFWTNHGCNMPRWGACMQVQ